MITQADVLRLVATSPFRKFVKLDYECFAGVESDDAMIGYNVVIDDDEIQYTIIIDGNRICLIDSYGGESHHILGGNIFA